MYDDPYLIALLPESIQIRTIDPNLFIQAVSVSKVRLLVSNKQGLLYLASQNYVWCLEAVPIAQQIKTLLEEKQFQLALKLAVSFFFNITRFSHLFCNKKSFILNENCFSEHYTRM